MRMRLSSWPALAIAVGVAVTSFGAVSLPRTYAAPLHSLAASDFHEVARQGFGDPQNSWAWSMEWFHNNLYVGTNRDYECSLWLIGHQVASWLVPYPPSYDANMAVPCNADPQAMPLAAEIWRVDPSSTAALTQSNWTLAYRSPYSATVNITNTSAITQAPRDMGFRTMSVYTDTEGSQALYVSGVSTKPINGKNVPPPSLLRTTDGTSFTPVPADPGTTMGEINTLTTIPTYYGGASSGGCCIRGQVSYGGKFLIVIGGYQGAGAVFASSDPRQGDNSFVQITPPNMKVFEIQPFNGHLYLGVDTNNGYGVLRTDCVTPESTTQIGCNQSDFTTVVPAGGGLGKSGNSGVTSMHVYTDPQGVQYLYVGTDGASNQTGAEIVRIKPGSQDDWDLIVGNERTVSGVLKTPLSGLGSGFGWYFNWHMWRMEDYNGVLYVGTYDGSTDWLNTSLGPQLTPYAGFDLWESPDGLSFAPVTQNGFGDKFSYGLRSIKATPYGLFLGSTNWEQGLRIWQGAVPSNAVQLAPSSVQADTVDAKSSLALTWDGGSNKANLYHIYRSAVSQRALPRPKSLTLDTPTSLSNLASKVWVPAAYTEIGTSTSPSFVDTSMSKGMRYNYYVVAQDANGNLSAPSGVTTYPSAWPALGFHVLEVLIAHWGKRGRLSSSQATTINHTLQNAYKRLKVGDDQGSYDLIDQMRQQLMSSAQGTTSKSRAEAVSFLLKRLERRVTLVRLHLISANRLF